MLASLARSRPSLGSRSKLWMVATGICWGAIAFTGAAPAAGQTEGPTPPRAWRPLEPLPREIETFPPPPSYELTRSPVERTRELALTAFCTAYFFLLGGMVGSFLNVVAWRMPRGENILWPGSRCPRCRTPIRLRDNVPILSWLWLRGRCRACREPISPRYVVVEALMASLFLGLAWWELLSGGANLPLRTPNAPTGVVWILWETKWDLLGIYAFHCCLLSLAMAFALIALDGRRVPCRLLAFGLLLGVALPLAWPWLRPVPFSFPWEIAPELAAWQRALFDAAAGLSVGLVLGLALRRGESEGPPNAAEAPVKETLPPADEIAVTPPETIPDAIPEQGGVSATLAVMLCAGAYLGWQAAAFVGAFAAAVALARSLIAPSRRRTMALPAALGIVALLAGWRWLFDLMAP